MSEPNYDEIPEQYARHLRAGAERIAGYNEDGYCPECANSGGDHHPKCSRRPNDVDLSNLEWRVVEAAVRWSEQGGAGGAAILEDPLHGAVDALISAREKAEQAVVVESPSCSNAL